MKTWAAAKLMGLIVMTMIAPPTPVIAETATKVAEVLSVHGSVTVSGGHPPMSGGRYLIPRVQVLRPRDDVFINDRILTGGKGFGGEGFVSLLLRNKATLSLRELSTLSFRETPTASVIYLSWGGIKFSVLETGDTFEIRTENAVTTVAGSASSGTIVILEVLPTVTPACPYGRSSRVTLLSGFAEIRSLGPVTGDPATSQPTGVPTPLNPAQSLTIPFGDCLGGPRLSTITEAETRTLAGSFEFPRRQP
jgi:hypothetical protein